MKPIAPLLHSNKLKMPESIGLSLSIPSSEVPQSTLLRATPGAHSWPGEAFAKTGRTSGSRVCLGIVTALLLSGCAPAILGGGAVIGTAALAEKGISGGMSDTQISTEIRMKLFQKDADLYYNIGVTVHNGEVMLSGSVPTDEAQLDAVRCAWETKGVTRVIDNIAVNKTASVTAAMHDTWITTKVKSTLLVDTEIHSVNFSIKTIEGVVYVMGIAQNQAELQKVTHLIRNTSGVKKVISYVQVKDGTSMDNSDLSTPAA